MSKANQDLLANTSCYISDVQSSKKWLNRFSNERHKNSWKLMQEYWKQSRSKQIPSIRVPRNRAAKTISLCFSITPVPKLISNNMKTNISAVVEFQRCWVLKSKIFGQESKDFFHLSFNVIHQQSSCFLDPPFLKFHNRTDITMRAADSIKE